MYCNIKKRIWETRNLSTDADSSTNTKTERDPAYGRHWLSQRVRIIALCQKTKKIKFLYGIGATIRIGREIPCLPYAGFFLFVCLFVPCCSSIALFGFVSPGANNLVLPGWQYLRDQVEYTFVTGLVLYVPQDWFMETILCQWKHHTVV